MENCCTEVIDLCINQGATYAKVFYWYGQVVVQGCVQYGPINITGYTGVMQIKAYPLASDVLFDATPYLTYGGAAGTIGLSIPASITETFTWWNGIYDLLMTSADGSYSIRLFQGAVQISPGVST